MHNLDEEFYLIVSPTILTNFIALKYEKQEISLYFLVGLRSLFLTNTLWIAQQAFMSSRVGNSLPIVPL